MDDPYEILGLAPGAGLREVEQSYQRLRNLYAEDSLATYALLDDEQRRQRLELIEQAFRRVVAIHVVPSGETGTGPTAATPDPPPPDREQMPGHYLRWLREHAGLTLRDVAERTKISPGKLDAIEQQRFQLLPPPVYLRGFVFEYARSLGHPDPRQLAERYLQLHPQQEQEG